MRVAIVAVLLLAGCASRTGDGLMHVIGRDFNALWIERDLQYWTACFSVHRTNHFYVGATELDHGRLRRALVYWKEERTIIDVGEPTEDATECMTWHHPLKLDRDTVDTADDVAGSTFLEPHRVWVTWMEECISRGRPYVVALDEARRRYPKAWPGTVGHDR